MKILITGGHLTPALAVIDYILAHQQDELVFVGRKFSQENKQLSQEYAQIKAREIPFFFFSAVKTSDLMGVKIIKSIPRFIWSLLKAWQILITTKPDVILSFGGYLALPMAMMGKCLGIPILTHEQTQVIGFANRLIGKLATKVAVSFSETQTLWDDTKVVLTGNPIRPQLLEKFDQPSWLVTKSKLPIMYVTGGNQGSKTINDFIANNLSWLLENWIIIHQCGNPTSDHNYQQELLSARQSLPLTQQNRYFVLPWVDLEQLAWIYQHAQLAFSRAGANTVLELAQFGIPAVLVPLPFSHLDEQLKNALWYQKLGGALILSQDQLSNADIKAQMISFGKAAQTTKKQIKLKFTSRHKEASALIYQELTKIKK